LQSKFNAAEKWRQSRENDANRAKMTQIARKWREPEESQEFSNSKNSALGRIRPPKLTDENWQKSWTIDAKMTQIACPTVGGKSGPILGSNSGKNWVKMSGRKSKKNPPNFSDKTAQKSDETMLRKVLRYAQNLLGSC
jgi:hypothetical protein